MTTRTNAQSLYNMMFILVFLLLAPTGCDWVEITQNHYRKEPPKQVTANINFEETTKAIVVYRNDSVPDKPWKKAVIDRVPSVANIRRVHVPSVKTPSMQTKNNMFNRQTSIHINGPERRYDSVIAKPNIPNRYQDEEIPTDTSEELEVPYNTNRGSSFERNADSYGFHKAHIANTNKLSKIESINKAYITNVKKGNLNQDTELIKSTYISNSENRGVINTTTEQTSLIKNQDDSDVNLLVMKEQLLPNNSQLKDFSNIVTPIVPSLQFNNSIMKKTGTLIKRIETKSEDMIKEEHNTHFKIQKENDKNKESIENENNESETIISDGLTNNTKTSTINTMWKLIKVITDSIYKSTRKSFKSKINYLEGLKTNILSSIEDQVEQQWPDDSGRSSRRTRDAGGRGHVEFPSSESALMSISFLTFAVFLIKLVLQVIHTYKNKTMMVTPAVVTAVGRAAAAMKSKTLQ